MSGAVMPLPRLVRAVLVTAALTIVPVLLPAGPALAVGEGLGWGAPEYLSPAGVQGLAPSVGVLADGTEVAGWEQSGPSGWFPVTASRPVAGNWSDPSPISSGPIDAPGTYSFGPRIAWDASGRYVAVWLVTRTQYMGDGTPVQQQIVEGAHGFQSPGAAASFTSDLLADRNTPYGFTYPLRPDVKLEPDGTGVIHVLYNCCAGETDLGLIPVHAGAPAGTPGKLTTKLTTRSPSGSMDDDNNDTPSVAVGPPSFAWNAPATTTMAALTGRPNYGTDPYKADLHLTADPGTWPATGTTLPLLAFGSTVAVLADGRELVTAPSGDGRLLMWRTGESGATTIDPAMGGGGSPIRPSIATAPDGSAAIAYMGQDAEHGVMRIRVVQVSGVGTVGAPVDVSAPDATARDPHAAFDPDGTLHVVWTQTGASGGPLETGVFSNYRLPGGDFLPVPQTVLGDVDEAHDARVAVARDGFVTVVAQVRSGALWRIAAFHHANPAVPRNVEKPAISAPGPITAGTTLTCSRGTWTASPSSFAFEWLVDGVSSGPAAAEPTHAVTSGEAGHRVVCRVIATNQAGSGKAESAAVVPGSVAAAAGGRLTLKGRPALSRDGASAVLTVSVPGSGKLAWAASGTAGKASAARKAKKAAALLTPGSVRVRRAGTVRITVRLSAAGKAKLRRTGKVALTVALRFTPASGRAATTSARVTFKPRRAKARR